MRLKYWLLLMVVSVLAGLGQAQADPVDYGIEMVLVEGGCCRACGNVEKRASGRFLNHAVMPDSESAVRHKGVAVAVKKRARGE